MRLLLLMAVLLLPACDPAPENGGALDLAGGPVLPDTQTIDGVLVMRHGADAFERAPVWTLDSVPVVVIDGGEEFDLSWTRPPVLLSDGRSVVLKSLGGGELMLFDSAGSPTRLLARTGNGPGELVAPAGLALAPGDTMVIADDANNAINWYTADSGLVRTSRLEATWRVNCYQSNGQLSDLRQVAIGYCSSNVMDEDRTLRGTTPLVLYALDRSTLDTVRMIPGIEMRMIDITQGSRTFSVPRNVELGRFPTATAVHSTIVLAGGIGGYVLELLSVDGVSRGRIVIERPVEPVTDTIRQAAIAEQLARIEETPYESGADIDRIKDDARNAPYADSLPAYGRVMSGADGVFWVMDFARPGDSTWAATAFRLDGTLVGRLSGARRGEGVGAGPVWFGDDRVMIRQVDEDGVVRFGVYPILKP